MPSVMARAWIDEACARRVQLKAAVDAHASVSACHISPKASGSVDTEANGQGSVAISAKGAACLHIE